MRLPRALRWIGVALLAALALVPVVLFAALLALRSEWGRERLRLEVLALARPFFAGELRLERIEGSFTGDLMLRGIEVRDLEGRTAVAIGSAQARYSIRDLIDRLHLEAIEVRDVHLEAFTTTTGINLAELLVPSEPSAEPSEPPTLSIGSIRIEALGFALDGERIVEEAGLSVGLAMERGRIDARRIELAVDGASLRSERAAFDPATLGLDTVLDLSVPAALASRLSRDPSLAGDLALRISVAHGELGPWRAEGEGTVAGSRFSLRADASADFAKAGARLRLFSADPHEIYRLAPQGRLDLDARARMEGGRFGLELNGRGTLAPPEAPALAHLAARPLAVDRITATATLSGAHLELAAELDAGPEHPRSRPPFDRVRVQGALDLERMALEETVASARIERIRSYLPPDLDLDGTVALDATLSGAFDALRVKGSARLSRLVGVASAERIEVHADLSGVPGRPSGGVRARARALGAPGIAVGRLSLEAELDATGRGTVTLRTDDGSPIESADARGKIQIAPDRVALDLSRADVLYRKTFFSAAPLAVSYEPARLSAKGRVRSPAGEVRLEVSVDPRALTTAPGRIELAAPALSLPVIGSLLPEPIDLAGSAALSITGRLGPARDLAAELSFSEVSFRGAAPVGGDARFRLQEALRGSVSAEAVGVAAVRAELSSAVPRDPLEWRPHHLQEVLLSVAPIDLGRTAAEIHALGGPRIDLTGSASVSASVRPAKDRFAVTTRVHGDVGAPIPAQLALTASASVPLDPGQWASIDHRAIDSALLTIEPIELGTVTQMAALDREVSGRLSLIARAGPRLDRISANVALDDVQLEEIEDPLHAAISAEATANRLTAGAIVRIGSRPTLIAEATLAAGLGDLLEGAPLLQRAGLSGKIRMLGIPLAPLSELVEREDAFAGDLVGTATVGGTIAAPRARIVLSGSDTRLGDMDFPRFRAVATYAPERATAELDLVQALGGRLALSAEIGLSDQRIELEARSSRFTLDFLKDVLPEQISLGVGGRLDADLKMAGVAEELSATGWLSLSDGKLVPPRPLSTLEKVSIDVKAHERTITVDAKATSGRGELAALIRTERTRSGVEVDGTLSTEDLPIALGKSPLAIDLVAAISGSISSEEMRITTAISDGLVELEEEQARELHEIAELEDVVFVDERGLKQQKKKRSRSSAPPKSARTEIAVRTVKPLPVKSSEVNGTVSADIRVIGGRAMGKVSLGDGAVQIGGRPWRIERARIDLDGSSPPRPVLDVLLIHEFESVVVSIFVTGTPDQPDIRFESSPATYDQAALLAIVLGADPDDPTSESPLGTKAAGAATNFVVGAVRSRLGSLWLDTFAVDLGEEFVPRLQLGKWIARELFVGYEHNFGASELDNRSEAILRYRFLPGWIIESRIGDKAQGLDLFWTMRF